MLPVFALCALALALLVFKLSFPISLLLLGTIIFLGSSTGLSPAHNFNVKVDRKGELYNWIRENTDKQTLFAGHPTHIDEMQLLGIRKAFVTTETAHPFYEEYFKEISRRMELVWQAYYATNLEEFLKILEAERIDYFVFRRYDFNISTLKKASYDIPFNRLVKKLASLPLESYLFSKLGLLDVKYKPEFVVFALSLIHI